MFILLYIIIFYPKRFLEVLVYKAFSEVVTIYLVKDVIVWFSASMCLYHLRMQQEEKSRLLFKRIGADKFLRNHVTTTNVGYVFMY